MISTPSAKHKAKHHPELPQHHETLEIMEPRPKSADRTTHERIMSPRQATDRVTVTATPTNLPLVSVVITSLNGMEVLPSCLNSLFRQTYPRVETILVDNGSTDGSGEYMKSVFPWICVVRTEQNLGFAGGCNLGAAHASGECILFLSNDTVVTPRFLEELVAVMQEDGSTGVVQSKTLSFDDHSWVDSVGAFFTRTGILYNPHRGECEELARELPDEVFSAQGACMMVRTELFRQLGGFDEDFVIYFDDTDLCWRAWLAGYRVRLAPRSVIYHKGGATTSSERSIVVVYHTFKNRLCSLIKNLAVRDMLAVVPLHLVICIMGSGLFIARLKPRSGLAILRAIAWNILNLGETLRKRRELGAMAVVGRSELFPSLERRMPVWHLIRQGLSYSSKW